MAEIVPCPQCGRPRAVGYPCPSCSLGGVPAAGTTMPQRVGPQRAVPQRSRSRTSPARILIGVAIFFAVAFGGAFLLHLYNAVPWFGANGVAHYSSSGAGFSLEYPASWRKISIPLPTGSTKLTGQFTVGDPHGAMVNGMAVDLLSIGAFQGTVNLSQSDSALVMPTLKKYLSTIVAQAPGVQILQQPFEFLTAAGVRGVKMSYTDSAGGKAVKGAFYVIPSGKTVYMVIAQAAAEHWQQDEPRFDTAVKSLKVTGA
jgi:hypothetical protein